MNDARGASMPFLMFKRVNDEKPVGASLLAKALGQATYLSNVPACSRASSLLQRAGVRLAA
ncbi:hypothetical protein EMIT0P218_120192 [Pseudomonas sp. IT-P218]